MDPHQLFAWLVGTSDASSPGSVYRILEPTPQQAPCWSQSRLNPSLEHPLHQLTCSDGGSQGHWCAPEAANPGLCGHHSSTNLAIKALHCWSASAVIIRPRLDWAAGVIVCDNHTVIIIWNFERQYVVVGYCEALVGAG